MTVGFAANHERTGTVCLHLDVTVLILSLFMEDHLPDAESATTYSLKLLAVGQDADLIALCILVEGIVRRVLGNDDVSVAGVLRMRAVVYRHGGYVERRRTVWLHVVDVMPVACLFLALYSHLATLREYVSHTVMAHPLDVGLRNVVRQLELRLAVAVLIVQGPLGIVEALVYCGLHVALR